jgi:hypothetical protein
MPRLTDHLRGYGPFETIVAAAAATAGTGPGAGPEAPAAAAARRGLEVAVPTFAQA